MTFQTPFIVSNELMGFVLYRNGTCLFKKSQNLFNFFNFIGVVLNFLEVSFELTCVFQFHNYKDETNFSKLSRSIVSKFFPD